MTLYVTAFYRSPTVVGRTASPTIKDDESHSSETLIVLEVALKGKIGCSSCPLCFHLFQTTETIRLKQAYAYERILYSLIGKFGIELLSSYYQLDGDAICDQHNSCHGVGGL